MMEHEVSLSTLCQCMLGAADSCGAWQSLCCRGSWINRAAGLCSTLKCYEPCCVHIRDQQNLLKLQQPHAAQPLHRYHRTVTCAHSHHMHVPQQAAAAATLRVTETFKPQYRYVSVLRPQNHGQQPVQDLVHTWTQVNMYMTGSLR